MNIDYNIRTEFQEAVAAFLTKIAAASPFETVKDKSFVREGMISRCYESDAEMVFRLVHQKREMDDRTETDINVAGFFIVSTQDKKFIFHLEYELPVFIAGDKIQTQMNLVRAHYGGATESESIGQAQLLLVKWSIFLRMLTFRYDLSYVGRNVNWVDRLPQTLIKD